MMIGAEAAALLVVIAAAVAAHEFAHLAACRLLSVPGELTLTWRGALLVPNPAVRTEFRHVTPRQFRIIALAPLVLCLPVLAGGLATGLVGLPTESVAGWAVLWWVVATLPSPIDWYNTYHAGDIKQLHAVWGGDHPRHAAAEGV